MKKLSLVAAVAAIAVAVPLGIGSSHREAPLTSIDPTVDDTDVYAFTAKDDPSTDQNEEKYLTVVANWIPFEDPAGGPNFYRFDDKARYYINLDNNGDGRYDIRYRFRFKTKIGNPNSFLYAGPTVDSIDDRDLNVKQSYTVERLVYDHASSSNASRLGKSRSKSHRRSHRRVKHRRKRGAHRSHAFDSFTVARDVPVAPNNVGPKTIPNYDAVAAQAIETLKDGTRIFAGQRDDPFFVDLGATFDSINLRKLPGNAGGGVDDLAGYSTHSVVLQVPERRVTRDRESVSGDDDRNGVVGVWASAERRKLQVTDSDEDGRGDFTQVSRLGNPLVNEVVIPLGQKDRFNRLQPADDATNFGRFVVEPELAKLMNALFGLGVKETDRSDIVLALLQGIPGLNQHQGSKGGTPVDTIKLNLGTPPAATENPLGVIGGDTAGFPNGRRLGDDVVDISLRVVAGILLSPPEQVTVPLGDGVPQNEKPFSNSFPYVASPDSGFNSKLKKQY
jgi:uncharacterized protein DUF4331